MTQPTPTRDRVQDWLIAHADPAGKKPIRTTTTQIAKELGLHHANVAEILRYFESIELISWKRQRGHGPRGEIWLLE